jgi:MFS family permease
MGFSELRSQALAAPPYLLSFFIVLFTAYLSDRYRDRSFFICLHAMVAFLGYALIAIGGWYRWSVGWRYAGICLATSGFFAAITIIITWTINNQDSDSKRGTGMAMLNIIGQCGPLLGTRLYPEEDGPFYIKGMIVCAGFMLVVLFVAVGLRAYLGKKNRRRDKESEENNGDTEGLVGGEKGGKEFRFIL